MPYYKITISLIAGICLGFGSLYLFIGLRHKNNKPLNLTFALFALCYATTLFNGIRWYSTTLVTEYIAITRFDSIFVAGAFVGLVWYIAYYAGVRPRIFLWGLSAALILPSLVFIISPATFVGEVSGLTYITLPWGENLASLDSTGSVWFDLLQLARLVTLGFIIFALIWQFWRGERQPAIILGLGILPFIVGVVYEVLGKSGVVPFIPFAEFGFLGIAIAASLQMANSIIRTEEELDRHRQNLTGLVETRTAELSQANESLTQEITERRQAEDAVRASQKFVQLTLDALSSNIAILDDTGTILAVNTSWRRFADENDLQWEDYGVGRNYLAVIDAASGDSTEGAREAGRGIRATAAGQQEQFWLEYPCHSPEEKRWFVIQVTRFESGDGVRVVTAHENITERKQIELALNQRLEELSVLHNTAEVLARTTDLPASLQAISETSLHFFQARTIHIIVPTLTEAEQVLMVGFEREGGPIGPAILDLSLKTLPLARKVIGSGQTQVFSDIQTLELEPLMTAYIREHNLRTVILVPLRVRGRTIGFMTVAAEDARRNFSPNEIKLAETIAGDIAAAVENARMAEQAKVVAVAEERGRLARDLHDSVTQTLYSASLVAEALPQVWENNPAEIKDHLTIILQLIRGALAEMRTLLLELRPETLEKTDLAPLLRQLEDALTGQTQVPVQVTVEGPAPILPPEVKIGLFRMAQEIFNNISKHAHATEVSVNFKNLANQVILEVQDNGRGFDPATVAPQRMGLRIMQERANDIGASFELESRPGQGTRISIIYEGQE